MLDFSPVKDPDVLPPYCSERVRLVDEWSTATKAYAESVHRVSRNLEIFGTPEYQELKDEAKRLRLASNDAFVRLEQHKQEHGCGSW